MKNNIITIISFFILFFILSNACLLFDTHDEYFITTVILYSLSVFLYIFIKSKKITHNKSGGTTIPKEMQEMETTIKDLEKTQKDVESKMNTLKTLSSSNTYIINKQKCADTHNNSNEYFINNNIEINWSYNNLELGLSKANISHSFLDHKDKKIKDYIQKGKKILQMSRVDNITTMNKTNSNSFFKKITDGDLDHIYLITYLNANSDTKLFPQINNILKDNLTDKLYISIENTDRTLTEILYKEIPLEILDQMNVSNEKRNSIMEIFSFKLPMNNNNRIFDVYYILNRIKFTRDEYIEFIKRVRNRVYILLDEIERKIQNLHVCTQKMGFIYTGVNTNSIGMIGKKIVFTDPFNNLSIYNQRDLSQYSIYDYSIDGSFSLSDLQIPITINKNINLSSDIQYIISASIKLYK